MVHNIVVQDDSANWLKWGKFVAHMASIPDASRPQTVADLKAAIAAAGVNAVVQGAANRPINWPQYSDNLVNALIIPLPTPKMIAADVAVLTAISAKPPGQRHYPLPVFYAPIFGNAPKVDLSKKELLDMAARRLGEYVINECM